MDINRVSDSDIDVEEYADMFSATGKDETTNPDGTVKQIVSRLPVRKSSSFQSLKKFSIKVSAENRQTLMSKITAEGKAEIERDREGYLKGSIEAGYKGETKDGTGSAKATIKADSDGNVSLKAEIEKEF